MKRHQGFIRAACSPFPSPPKTYHRKSFGGEAPSARDTTKAGRHWVLPHRGQHPTWVPAAVATPAQYPESRTPKHLAETVLPLPPFLPGASVTGFIAPSSVCQANCTAGSQRPGPWVRQRLAPHGPRASKQNTLVPSKPGCAREKKPGRCGPICSSAGRAPGVMGPWVQSRG